MSKILVVAALLSTFALACEGEKTSAPAGANTGASTGAAPTQTAAAQAPKGVAPGEPTPGSGAAGDAPCDAVVAKLASYDATAGEPEKKLWTKMCADMPAPMRACIVASKTKEERDACGKDQKLK